MCILNWLPTITSILTLAVNIIFYVCIQSRLGYEYKRKEDLAAICECFFKYLSELISYDDFDGAPTEIRNYSLKIHLCFKDGQADQYTTEMLETLYQQVKERKTLESCGIEKWNIAFRENVRKLRCRLGKYCGGISPQND